MIRYLSATVAGLGLIAGGAAVVGYGWYAAIRKNAVCVVDPDVRPEECAATSLEPLFYLILGGIAVALIAIPIYGSRARQAGGGGLLAGIAIFLGVAVAGFAAAWGPAAVPEPSIVWLLLAFVFAAMAIAAVPLLFTGSDAAARNPLVLIAGLAAVAAGAFGGFAVAGGPLGEHASLELTGPIVTGEDDSSHFLPGPLREAVGDAEAKLGDEPVFFVTVEPRGINVRTWSAPGGNPVTIAELPVRAPEMILAGVNDLRAKLGADPVDLDDVISFTWRPADPLHPWSVALKASDTGEPSRFAAAANGGSVAVEEDVPAGGARFGG